MNNPVKDYAKVVLNIAQDLYVLGARSIGKIDFPVPPNSSMRKTSSKTINHYYISGIRCYLPIAAAAVAQGVLLGDDITVLDFGCGVGRQLLHFTKHYPGMRFHACDIDFTHIDFIRRHYGAQVDARTTQFSPPLPYPDGLFDMIYSVSIFSHLPPADQEEWVRELCRVTKPGGYCFLTTEGPKALDLMDDMFGRPDESRAALARDGTLYREYRWVRTPSRAWKWLPTVNPSVGIEGSYGCTVTSPAYIRQNWSQWGFEVVQILEGIIDHRQDLVILRRPA